MALSVSRTGRPICCGHTWYTSSPGRLPSLTGDRGGRFPLGLRRFAGSRFCPAVHGADRSNRPYPAGSVSLAQPRGSAADNPIAKPHAAIAGRNAIAEQLRRTEIDAEARFASLRSWYGVRLLDQGSPPRGDRRTADRDRRVGPEVPGRSSGVSGRRTEIDVEVVAAGERPQLDLAVPCLEEALGKRVAPLPTTSRLGRSAMVNRAVEKASASDLILLDEPFEVLTIPPPPPPPLSSPPPPSRPPPPPPHPPSPRPWGTPLLLSTTKPIARPPETPPATPPPYRPQRSREPPPPPPRSQAHPGRPRPPERRYSCGGARTKTRFGNGSEKSSCTAEATPCAANSERIASTNS